MTSTPRIGDAAHALWRSQILESLAGNYVVSRLDAQPGASGSAIQSSVDDGSVRFAATGTVDVAGDTLTHDPVANQYDYRMDVIYATRQGGLAVAKGQPGQPAPTVEDADGNYPAYTNGGTPQVPRRLYWPAPPDGSQINGLPLHVVVLADTMADSTDLALEDYVDYRIPAVDPGEHTHPDIALNRRTYDLQSSTGEIVKLATINDGTTGFGACRVAVWSANALQNVTPRTLEVDILTRGSAASANARVFGNTVDPVSILVTEQSASVTGTPESRYHLYARAPSGTGAYVTVEHRGDSWGGDQFTDGLGDADVLGTVVSDTADPSVGGSTGRVLSPAAGSGSEGDVAIRQPGGNAAWKNLGYGTGDWEPLMTESFPKASYSTTTDKWEGVTPYKDGLVYPTPLFENSHFSAYGISLAANLRLSTETGGAAAKARLTATTTSGGKIDGTAIQEASDAGSTLWSGVAEWPANHLRVFLEMDSDGTKTATCQHPTVTFWGRQQ